MTISLEVRCSKIEKYLNVLLLVRSVGDFVTKGDCKHALCNKEKIRSRLDATINEQLN